MKTKASRIGVISNDFSHGYTCIAGDFIAAARAVYENAAGAAEGRVMEAGPAGEAVFVAPVSRAKSAVAQVLTRSDGNIARYQSGDTAAKILICQVAPCGSAGGEYRQGSGNTGLDQE